MTAPIPVGIASQAVAGKHVPQGITDLVAEFYRRSDIADDSWLDLLEPDIKMTVHGEMNGHGEIHAAREHGREVRANVVHRFHHIMATGPDEVFVTGDIDYDNLVTGQKIRNLSWVARMKLNAKADKVKEYYVWVVSVCEGSNRSMSLLRSVSYTLHIVYYATLYPTANASHILHTTLCTLHCDTADLLLLIPTCSFATVHLRRRRQLVMPLNLLPHVLPVCRLELVHLLHRPLGRR